MWSIFKEFDMRFTFDKKDFASGGAKSACWLITNGLGGFMSMGLDFGLTRCDQGLLISTDSPSRRYDLVHCAREELSFGGEPLELSDPVSFVWDAGPEWRYEAGDVILRRRCGMEPGENASAVVYDLENKGSRSCALAVRPVFQFSQKGEPPRDSFPAEYAGGTVRAAGLEARVASNAKLRALPVSFEDISYPDDERDGRRPSGVGFTCCEARLEVPAGGSGSLWLTFSRDGTEKSGFEIVADCLEENRRRCAGFSTPEASELARAAGDFIAYRASTGGKTVIAGYPFFGDWGRDTMISLPGCTLSTGRLEDAKSILRTFIHYERGGLLPNYFPEGQEEPQYNSADAPLLFINCVWLYYRRSGDGDFVRKAWGTMKSIVSAYINGARYAIKTDSDGLVCAGEGFDQVTWMDVRVGDILPTPRHGKPVEINAYWYSDLRAMALMAPEAGESGEEFDKLADKVRESFNREFWMEDRGYLRDVISGTDADTQLRCNQIWAVSMPFTMLSPERERRVVETVGKYLYTPQGLRTLSPDDPDFHPTYGGTQLERDMAYHQGTVWPFPMGAYYLSLLKVMGNTPQAAAHVRKLLGTMPEILREGCVGQLPEIYDGLEPRASKGCFAQAWSVGELLRVYEALENIEREAGENA